MFTSGGAKMVKICPEVTVLASLNRNNLITLGVLALLIIVTTC